MDVVTNPNFFGSHRALDRSLLKKLEILELRIRHVRSRLQNLHESISTVRETNTDIGGLVPIADGNGLREVKVVHHKCCVLCRQSPCRCHVDCKGDGIDASDVVNGDLNGEGSDESI